MSKDEIPKDIWVETIFYEQKEGSNKVTRDRIWSYWEK